MCMTFDDLYKYILTRCPDAEMGEDNEGQVLIYTGMMTGRKVGLPAPVLDDPYLNVRMSTRELVKFVPMTTEVLSPILENLSVVRVDEDKIEELEDALLEGLVARSKELGISSELISSLSPDQLEEMVQNLENVEGE